jgi:hypothetical protein
MSEMNYEQFLSQCMQQPFSVSLTLIESIFGSTSQISQTFTLKTQDANGNQVVRSIEPTFDPYQQESTTVVVKQNFSIDAFTKLKFSIINGSTVFRIHLLLIGVRVFYLRYEILPLWKDWESAIQKSLFYISKIDLLLFK